MNTDLTINDNELAIILPTMVRSTNKYEPTRERVTGEKYFRQAIFVFNKEGNYVDSGFIQINDYTNMCKMVKVCNKSKKNIHLFERWEHYDNSFNKTDKFDITDLASGNNIGILKDTDVLNYVNINENCFVGDLEKDEYSEVLLECLNAYSSKNAPVLPLFNFQFKETCGCDIFKVLDETQNKKIFDRIICNCKNTLPKPELTEEQRIKREEFQLKAVSEITDVFSKNGLLTTCFSD